MSVLPPLGEVPYYARTMTEHMPVLTAIQQAVLAVIAKAPGKHLDDLTVVLVQETVLVRVGRLNLVRIAVAAGQLEQKGLLRYERNLSSDLLDWFVTSSGTQFLATY